MSAIELYARPTPGFDDRVAQALARLQRAAEQHSGRIVQSTSLGAEDMVVTDLIARHQLPIAIATLDTGALHPETLGLIDTITQRLPNTLALAGLAFVAATLVAIPLGLVMAILTRDGRRRPLELGFTSSAMVVAAIPEFLLAVLLVYVFAVSWGVLPIAGKSGPASYVLPVASMALGGAMALSRLVRVEVLGILGQDFIRTARSKRLRDSRISLRHALPNAVPATLTVSGLLLAGLVVGSVLVETIFAWPGLGPMLVSSILAKDYPMVQGIVLVYGTMVLLINLVVDLVLAVLDPRSTIRAAA